MTSSGNISADKGVISPGPCDVLSRRFEGFNNHRKVNSPMRCWSLLVDVLTPPVFASGTFLNVAGNKKLQSLVEASVAKFWKVNKDLQNWTSAVPYITDSILFEVAETGAGSSSTIVCMGSGAIPTDEA